MLLDLHSANCVYIPAMLATPELIREAGQLRATGRTAAALAGGAALPRFTGGGDKSSGGPTPSTVSGGCRCWPSRRCANNFPQNFLPAGQTLETLLENNLVELEHTSGTSEERLPVIFGHGWWNAQEERALRLNRFVADVLDEHPNARRATLVPPACNGLTCPTVWMSREQRTIGNALFVNLARIPFLLDDAELARMAEEISEWSPQFLDLDPVHGARFALYCEQHGVKFPSLKFILCSYEFVSVVHRRILERVFGAPVFNLVRLDGDRPSAHGKRARRNETRLRHGVSRNRGRRTGRRRRSGCHNADQ